MASLPSRAMRRRHCVGGAPINFGRRLRGRRTALLPRTLSQTFFSHLKMILFGPGGFEKNSPSLKHT